MQKITAFMFAIVFGIAALGMTTSPARALVIYSYAGNNFTTIVDSDPPAGSYDTTMSVSGSFTVAAPLVSLPTTDISTSVLSYSFNDGRQTLDDGNSLINNFTISTNNTGLLTSWFISVVIPFPRPISAGDLSGTIETISGVILPIDLDQGVFGTCTAVVDIGGTSDCAAGAFAFDVGFSTKAGTWSGPKVLVPEPSTLLLFGVGLAGLAGFGRRRRQV